MGWMQWCAMVCICHELSFIPKEEIRGCLVVRSYARPRIRTVDTGLNGQNSECGLLSNFLKIPLFDSDGVGLSR